jgi:tetratricopeptide (TPR) repeat protein
MTRSRMTQTFKELLIGLAILVVTVFGVIVYGVMLTGPSKEEALFSELILQGQNLIISGELSQAEQLHKRLLAMAEKALGKDHPDVLTERNQKEFVRFLRGLTGSHRFEGNYLEVELVYKRSLPILEKTLGPNHPYVALVLMYLGKDYLAQNKYSDAERVMQRALAIMEKSPEKNRIGVANALSGLALVYYKQGKYSEAEPLFKRALAIAEKRLGPNHPDMVILLEKLAGLHEALGNTDEAKQYRARIQRIRSRSGRNGQRQGSSK